MSDIMNRYLTNTVNAFIPKKEYTAEQVIENLKRDIRILSDYLMNNIPDTNVWRQKSQLLGDKKAELEKFEQETLNQK